MDTNTSKSKAIQTLKEDEIYQAYNGQYYKQMSAFER